MSSSEQSNTGRPEPAWPYLLLALTFAVLPFYWTLGFDFVWDDRLLIVDNEWLLDPATAWQGFFQSFWELNQRAEHIRHFYRPLVSLTYFLQRNFQGLDAQAFHAFNLALHGANAVLAFLLARRFLGSPSLALAAAVLFAAHPTRPESVVWISGRTDLLAAFFAFAAMAVWTSPRPLRGRHWALAGVLYLLALFSKEVAVGAPLAACFLAPPGAPLRSKDSLRRLAWGSGAVLALYLVLRYIALRNLLSATLPATPPQYAAALGWVLAQYARLALMIPPFHAHLPWPSFEAMQGGLLAGGLLILGAGAVGGLWLARRGGAAARALGLAGVFLAPALLLGRFGDVLYACRFFYLPALGLGLLAALGLAAVAARLPRAWQGSRFALPAAGLLGLLATAASVLASAPWRDDLSLFGSLRLSSTGSCYIQTNYGLALAAAGRWSEAEAAYRRALALRPGDLPARHGLAQSLREQGRLEDALVEYRRVMARTNTDGVFTYNYAEALQAAGRVKEAELWYREALRRDLRAHMAAHNLGHLLLLQRRFDEAEPWLRQGLLGKDPALSRNSLGILFAERGDKAAARREFEEALRLKPGMPQATANLQRLESMR